MNPRRSARGGQKAVSQSESAGRTLNARVRRRGRMYGFDYSERDVATVDQKRGKWWKDGIINLCFIASWCVNDIHCSMLVGNTVVSDLPHPGFLIVQDQGISNQRDDANGYWPIKSP